MRIDSGMQQFTWKTFKTITILLVLLFSYLLPGQSLAQAKHVDDKWALVVGISEFQDPSMNLKYPAKDAKDFRDYLINEANFAPDHVRLLTNEKATKVNILTELGDKWLPKVALPNDLVVIYISSHGSPSKMDNEGCNYLVAHDTQKGLLYATGISLQELSKTIRERVHSERILVVLDACHSGSAKAKVGGKGLVRTGNFDMNSFPMGKGIILLCSSQPDQVSWESKKYNNGVFTKQLIEGLKYRGKYTKIGEAFNVMKKGVQAEVITDRGEVQTPVLKSAWKGDDIIIASKPLNPRPGVKQSPPVNQRPTQPINTVATTSTPLGLEVHPVPTASTGSAIGGQNIGITLMDRVAILPVTGPKEFLLKGSWKGWAEKDNINVPLRYKQIGVNETIQATLKKELLKRLKKKKDVILLKFDDVSSSNYSEGDIKLASKSILSPQNMINWNKLGRMAQAKFLLEITVHNIEFEDTAYGDIAGARVSARLVSGETGEVLWLQKRKKFSRVTAAFHDDSIFAEVRNFVSSKIAKEFSKPIAKSLKDF